MQLFLPLALARKKKSKKRREAEAAQTTKFGSFCLQAQKEPEEAGGLSAISLVRQKDRQSMRKKRLTSFFLSPSLSISLVYPRSLARSRKQARVFFSWAEQAQIASGRRCLSSGLLTCVRSTECLHVGSARERKRDSQLVAATAPMSVLLFTYSFYARFVPVFAYQN